MIRVPAIVIGIFLVALWIGGLSVNSATWLTWLDLLGAVIAFGVAAMPAPAVQGANDRSIVAGLLALGLFALWIAGLVLRVQPWLVWSTFAAACAMGLVAVGVGTTRMDIEQRRTV